MAGIETQRLQHGANQITSLLTNVFSAAAFDDRNQSMVLHHRAQARQHRCRV